EALPIKPAMLLGSAPMPLRCTDTRIVLEPGETLIFYTDGYFEATGPDEKTEFGIDRLREALGGPRTALPLPECAAAVTADIARFTGKAELQDDQTLLMLRRRWYSILHLRLRQRQPALQQGRILREVLPVDERRRLLGDPGHEGPLAAVVGEQRRRHVHVQLGRGVDRRGVLLADLLQLRHQPGHIAPL